jgi:mono/diheme cytochrome c family protein
MSQLKALTVLPLAILIALIPIIGSGLIDPAADRPHSRPVHWVLEMLRKRGVATRANDLEVPDLTAPILIRSGAGNYDAMCAGCHLKPGTRDSELHRGLYPRPPALASMTAPTTPQHAFWIIKHGIKASGMPAWGLSMDDEAIWGMVAFLQRLPGLTATDYRELVAESAGHSHSAAASDRNNAGAREHAQPVRTGAKTRDAGHMDEHEHREGHEPDEGR